MDWFAILCVSINRIASAVTKHFTIMYVDRINPNLPEGRLLVSSRGFELKLPSLPQSATPLSEKAGRLFAHLQDKNFEPFYEKHMQKCLNLIVGRGAERNVEAYSALLKEMPKERNFLTYWLLYDFYDMLPDGKKINVSAYNELSSYYRGIIDDGMRLAQKTGIRDLTISVEASMTSSFFWHLQSKNVECLSNLAESQVREYTRSGHCTPMVVYRISLFLRRYATIIGNEEILAILPYFPKERLDRKVYPALTSKERSKLEAVVLDEGNSLSKKDRAMISLMLYLGMRSNDVRNLRISDIDWVGGVIRFKQGKTGGEIILPMRPVVGNFLSGYLLEERPKCNDERLFIPREQRAGKYGECSIQYVVNHAYDLAGIRKQGDHRGTHLLRHSFADEMINSGSDVTLVSKALGHLNPNTTLGYLSSNVEQLRACALSIKDIPVKHRLYCNE